MSYLAQSFFEKPQGVRDYLPGIAAQKRGIEQQIMRHYSKWGYEEVITPTLEYMDLFQNGSMKNMSERVFKFFERSGRTIVLRPDMTAPISRVVSTLLHDHSLPLRLSYQGSLFRIQEMTAGRDAEFTQAGVELVGDGTVDADAEVIALAVQTLKEVGVEGFRIAIGHVQFLQAILEEYIEDVSVQDALRKALEVKNYVTYEEILTHLDRSERVKQILREVTSLRGGLDSLQRARKLTNHPKALEAIEELEELWNTLKLYHVEQYITIDLSVMLAMHYYTAIVFEGYAPRIGFPVCGGGRYDELYSKFGRSIPATGFMIGVDRLLDLLLEKTVDKETETYLFSFQPSDPMARQTAIAFASFTRAQGMRVAVQNRQSFQFMCEHNTSSKSVCCSQIYNLESNHNGMSTVEVRFEEDGIQTDDQRIIDLFISFQMSRVE